MDYDIHASAADSTSVYHAMDRSVQTHLPITASNNMLSFDAAALEILHAASALVQSRWFTIFILLTQHLSIMQWNVAFKHICLYRKQQHA